MIIDNKNFRFRLSVSTESYETKQDTKACLNKAGAKAIGRNKMAFREYEVSIDEFMKNALSGYCFCNLFKFDPTQKYWIEHLDKKYQMYPLHMKGPNKGAMKLAFKRDEFFYGSQVIFVDIDYTRFERIPDYLDSLSLKPTCVYMSFSDGKEKHGKISRRFRMVYVFSEVLDASNFIRISRAITDMIVKDTREPMDDDCGCRKSQFFNGVYGNTEAYCTYYIYEPSDFPNPVITYNEQVEDDIPPVDSEIEDNIKFSDTLLYEMKAYPYTDFMHYNSWRYEYFYRSESPMWIGEKYQYTREDYLQLWWYREPVKDTERRRRKLFKRACLRILMRPNVDPDTLIFNMYVDSHKFFDNSDDILNVDTLVFYCKKALSMNKEDLTEYCQKDIDWWKQNRPKFITKGCTNSDIRSITGKVNRNEFASSFDASKSVAQNADELGVSRRSAYRYCNEMDISTTSSRDDRISRFKELYDKNLSLRQNKEMLEQNNLPLSLDTIRRWKADYIRKVPEFAPLWNFSLPKMKDLSSYYENSIWIAG